MRTLITEITSQWNKETKFRVLLYFESPWPTGVENGYKWQPLKTIPRLNGYPWTPNVWASVLREKTAHRRRKLQWVFMTTLNLDQEIYACIPCFDTRTMTYHAQIALLPPSDDMHNLLWKIITMKQCGNIHGRSKSTPSVYPSRSLTKPNKVRVTHWHRIDKQI